MKTKRNRKSKKNNLDERQEQVLLKIEHNGCWFAFWGLFAAIMVQQVIYGNDSLAYSAGELIVFFPLTIYLVVSCVRHGIWDRRLKANRKTNLLLSFGGALCAGMIVGITNYLGFGILWSAALSGVITVIFTFILCYFLMTFSAKQYRKKQRELEAEYDDDISEKSEK